MYSLWLGNSFCDQNKRRIYLLLTVNSCDKKEPSKNKSNTMITKKLGFSRSFSARFLIHSFLILPGSTSFCSPERWQPGIIIEAG